MTTSSSVPNVCSVGGRQSSREMINCNPDVRKMGSNGGVRPAPAPTSAGGQRRMCVARRRASSMSPSWAALSSSPQRRRMKRVGPRMLTHRPTSNAGALPVRARVIASWMAFRGWSSQWTSFCIAKGSSEGSVALCSPSVLLFFKNQARTSLRSADSFRAAAAFAFREVILNDTPALLASNEAAFG